MRECITKWLGLALSLVLTLPVAVSCGGGSGSSVPDPQPQPQPQDTELSGQILQDSAARVSSNAGTAIAGAEVSLINPASGAVLATTSTDSAGRYRLSGISAGERQLRLGFDGGADMDGDGSRDNVEVLLPVTVKAEQETEFNATVKSFDLDDDGDPDGFDIDSLTREELGEELRRLIRLLIRLHILLIDEDGDGDLIDDDPFEDEDSDGIPDGIGGHHNSLHGGVLRGRIEEISDDSITVDGITFEINEETRWKDKGNKDPDPDVFDEGTMVLVKGRWDGEAWIAREVKTSGPRPHDDDDDDDDDDGDDGNAATFHGTIELLSSGLMSIDGRSFELNASTAWFIEGSGEVEADLFDIGDFVMVEAREEDDVWVARRVTMISDDDEEIVANFSGVLVSIGESGLSVAGQPVRINAETDFVFEDGSPALASDFAAGDSVAVRARQEGTIWVALEVRLLEDGGEPLLKTFSGAIELLSISEIVVAGQSIELTSETEWFLDGGVSGSIGQFAIGDAVEVLARQEGSAWTALEVSLTDEGGLGGVL